jgi:hypothetical protein
MGRYCVDNVLIKICDPVFVGWAEERDVDVACKVSRLPLHRRVVAYSRRSIAAPSHRRVIASPHHSTVAVASLRRFLPLCVCVRKRACVDRAIGLACTFEKGSVNGSSRQAVVAVLFEQVVPKRSAHESVGVLANRDGQVREYSRTPPLPLPPFATPIQAVEGLQRLAARSAFGCAHAQNCVVEYSEIDKATAESVDESGTLVYNAAHVRSQRTTCTNAADDVPQCSTQRAPTPRRVRSHAHALRRACEAGVHSRTFRVRACA